MKKVHLLAGPNNVGKSNAIRVASVLLPSIASGWPQSDQLDVPVKDGVSEESALRLSVAIPREALDLEGLSSQVSSPRREGFLSALFASPTFESDSADDEIWFEFEQGGHEPGSKWQTSKNQLADVLDAAAKAKVPLGQISSSLTGQSSGNDEINGRNILQSIVTRLDVASKVPRVLQIGAFRQIVEHSDVQSPDGAGLIEKLARLQHPPVNAPADITKFKAINRFIADLFEDPEVRLEVPPEHDHLIVNHHGRRMPLDHFGTGLHQAVILAATATAITDHLVCIEEPEINLHPLLQRKLIAYLDENTDNRYLIATHSAHLLDANRASISSLELVDGFTCVKPAVDPAQLAKLSADLGIRGSDLVQSNAVVWVEGPSDRIYVRHWLRAAAPELVEGIHYSVMFYGGSLLSHLSPQDPTVGEFISLPRMNRNFVVLIDSDRKKPRQKINATKQRIVDELSDEDSGSFVWITDGYTIENYVPRDLLADALHVVHPQAKLNWAGGKYEAPLGVHGCTYGGKSVDKVAIASEVTKVWDGKAQGALKKSVDRLVDLIRAANDLDS